MQNILQFSLFADRPAGKWWNRSELTKRAPTAKNWVVSVNNPSRTAGIRAERKLLERVAKKHVAAGSTNHLPAPVLPRCQDAQGLKALRRRFNGWHEWEISLRLRGCWITVALTNNAPQRLREKALRLVQKAGPKRWCSESKRHGMCVALPVLILRSSPRNPVVSALL